MDNNSTNKVISPLIKDKFEVIGVVPGKVKFGAFEYDLCTIDLATAEELVKNKFPYLKAKKVK
jgi:hypothetical protein